MHTPTVTVPELEDILMKMDEQDTLSEDSHFLLNEVRFSDLRRMNDANLQGRLDYYLKEYIFELNPRKRTEFYREVIRTRIEIRRRVVEARAHTIAKVLAEEAKPAPGTIEELVAA